MPELFYTRLHSLLMCGTYADRIQPFLQEFPRSKYAAFDSRPQPLALSLIVLLVMLAAMPGHL